MPNSLKLILNKYIMKEFKYTSIVIKEIYNKWAYTIFTVWK